MRPFLNDRAVTHDENPVGLHDGRQAMRDDQRRSPFGYDLQRLLDKQFYLGIQVGGRFAQNQNLRTESDILANRRAEEESVLRNVSDLLAQAPQRQLTDIHSANLYRPRRRVIRTQQQLDDRRLAAARPSNDTRRHARLDDQIDPPDQPGEMQKKSAAGDKIEPAADIHDEILSVTADKRVPHTIASSNSL